MSKKSRILKQARQELRGSGATILREPADVIAMIPYVVGFTPVDSLVVVALLPGKRQRFGPCFRLDLAADGSEADGWARYLLDIVAMHGFETLIAVAFTGDAGRADALLRPFLRGLRERGVRVAEALRADGDRWWSYLCSDPTCCSGEGTAYDADASWVAAEAVLAGMHRLPDRDSLRSQFEPLAPEARHEVEDACERLWQRRYEEDGPGLGVAGLDRLVLRNLADPDSMPADDIAELLVAVQNVALRDAAWSLMTRTNAAAHFLLWRRVMQSASDDLMAPAGGLTGFAAWLDGRGVDASHVVERVDQVRPGYSMCRLLREMLDATVNPDVWTQFPLVRDPAE